MTDTLRRCAVACCRLACGCRRLARRAGCRSEDQAKGGCAHRGAVEEAARLSASNVPDSVANQLADILEVPRTVHMEKYLGIPLVKGRIKKEIFHELIASIKKQLSKWKANSLSQAGRALLIQSNLNSKVNYMMQSFLLPKSVCEEIDKIYKKFSTITRDQIFTR